MQCCKTIIKDLTVQWKTNVDSNYEFYEPSTNSGIVKPGAHLNRIPDVIANLNLDLNVPPSILDYGMSNGDLSSIFFKTTATFK